MWRATSGYTSWQSRFTKVGGGMQGGLLFLQRHGRTFFCSAGSSVAGASSLTFAERVDLLGFDTGCSGDEPHPSTTQTITQTNERTGPRGTTTKTLGQPPRALRR